MAISKIVYKENAEATPVVWMDTTDKTADSGNMLNGTTALKNDGTTATGNIQSQAAQTIYPSTSDQTIASGKYLTGAQTIKGVLLTNLTAGNIKKDVVVKVGDSADDDRITSVTGTYEGSGGGSTADYKAFIERSTDTPTLPSDLTSIGDYAFSYWSSLALTALPSSLTSIGQQAFRGCTNLTLTSLPSGLTSIDSYAFASCPNLALTSLPSSLTRIEQYAFQGCTSLALTSLPSSIVYIGSAAFSNCAGLQTISCDGAIAFLGASAFNGNTTYPMTLQEAFFPNLSASINTVFGSTTAAYACQQLETVDAGKITLINADAFANCYKLQTLVLRRTNAICSLANTSAFTNTPMSGYNSLTGTVYVPNALIAAYQTATNWKTLYDAGYISFVKIEGSIYE